MLLDIQVKLLELAVEAGQQALLGIFAAAHQVGDEDTVAYILERTDWHTEENFGEHLEDINAVAVMYEQLKAELGNSNAVADAYAELRAEQPVTLH